MIIPITLVFYAMLCNNHTSYMLRVCYLKDKNSTNNMNIDFKNILSTTQKTESYKYQCLVDVLVIYIRFTSLSVSWP